MMVMLEGIAITMQASWRHLFSFDPIFSIQSPVNMR